MAVLLHIKFHSHLYNELVLFTKWELQITVKFLHTCSATVHYVEGLCLQRNYLLIEAADWTERAYILFRLITRIPSALVTGCNGKGIHTTAPPPATARLNGWKRRGKSYCKAVPITNLVRASIKRKRPVSNSPTWKVNRPTNYAIKTKGNSALLQLTAATGHSLDKQTPRPQAGRFLEVAVLFKCFGEKWLEWT